MTKKNAFENSPRDYFEIESVLIDRRRFYVDLISYKLLRLSKNKMQSKVNMNREHFPRTTNQLNIEKMVKLNFHNISNHPVTRLGT